MASEPEDEHRFIVSRFPDIFREVGSMLLGKPIRHVEEILVGKPVEGCEIPERDMYDPEKKNDVHEFLTDLIRIEGVAGAIHKMLRRIYEY